MGRPGSGAVRCGDRDGRARPGGGPECRCAFGTRGAPGTARGTKPGAFFYKAADPAGQKWDRMVLDDSIAANSCVTADINGDRKMDLACIDAGNPWSLKWYENTRK